jgi:hypothetical protein
MPARMTAARERTSAGEGMLAVGENASLAAGGVLHEQACTHAAIP